MDASAIEEEQWKYRTGARYCLRVRNRLDDGSIEVEECDSGFDIEVNRADI